MTKEIRIQVEKQNQGDWLNIYIPYKTDEDMFGILQNERCETLKKVKLKTGNNAIDISNIRHKSINIKIETAYETILKNLNLS